MPILMTMPTARGYELSIQTVPARYQLTYKDQVVQQRMDCRIANAGYKYIRSTWSNEKSAQNCVKKLNKFFHTEHFGCRKIESGQG